jgi:hypothetical protein
MAAPFMLALFATGATEMQELAGMSSEECLLTSSLIAVVNIGDLLVD